MPYRAEVISHRRPRGERRLENLTEVAYFRTKREATAAAKERADERHTSYAEGGDYHFEGSYRIKKDKTFHPDKHLPRPRKRPPVAKRDRQGRYRDRRGRYIKGGRKEALRRLRISRKLRQRAAAIRRAKNLARQRYGQWAKQTLESVDDSPKNFDASWTFYEPEAMTFEG